MIVLILYHFEDAMKVDYLYVMNNDDNVYFQDCLNAIGKHFHPECFSCVYCGKLFGNNPFFLEDGLPYCEAGNDRKIIIIPKETYVPRLVNI